MNLGSWFRSSSPDESQGEEKALSLESIEDGAYPDAPVELTDGNMDQAVQRFPLVVVDCWAPWCGPCVMVAPVVAELAKDYTGKVVFGKLNVDENPQISMRYRISSIPSLLVFKQGELVDMIIGAQPRQLLEPQITRHLQDEGQ